MDQFRKEMMFSLLDEWKKEKKQKDKAYIKGRVQFLGILLAFGIFLLVVILVASR